MATTRNLPLTTSCGPSASLPFLAFTARHGPSQTAQIQELTASVLEALERLGPEFSVEHRRVAALQERLDENRFHLAVLGQFKRGKSILLNALLGEALLPSSVVPLTSIPTFIRRGQFRRVRVFRRADDQAAEELSSDRVEDLSAFLSQFVTEAANPRNIKQVSHVEVSHPAPILRHGVVLIDTPGIGSTFRHNTEATLNFLAECDAALFLVSADPPLTEVEVEFLKKVRAKVAKVFFVLNKVDYLSVGDCQDALEFLRDVLSEHAAVAGGTPIFATSALQGLRARETSDRALWVRIASQIKLPGEPADLGI